MKAWIDHVVLNVRDVERSLVFYVDVIGLVPERLDEYRTGEVIFPSVRVNEYSVIDLAGPTLWDPDEQGVGATNVNHFCICVEDDEWPSLVARLERAGIEFEAGPMTLWGARGDATGYYLRDPDGNLLELRYYG